MAGVGVGIESAFQRQISMGELNLHRHLLRLLTVAMLTLQLLQTPALACSPQELAIKVNTVTDLMIARESRRTTDHTALMQRMHAMMVQTTRQSDISYDGLCASYDELIVQLKSTPGSR
jgi:citrate lyase beta subunit